VSFFSLASALQEICRLTRKHGSVRQQYPFQDACPLSDVNAYCSSHGGNTGTAGCFEATDREPQYVVRCGELDSAPRSFGS
jgi:hypothetical protein